MQPPSSRACRSCTQGMECPVLPQLSYVPRTYLANPTLQILPDPWWSLLHSLTSLTVIWATSTIFLSQLQSDGSPDVPGSKCSRFMKIVLSCPSLIYPLDSSSRISLTLRVQIANVHLCCLKYVEIKPLLIQSYLLFSLHPSYNITLV